MTKYGYNPSGSCKSPFLLLSWQEQPEGGEIWVKREKSLPQTDVSALARNPDIMLFDEPDRLLYPEIVKQCWSG
ncbi:MAG: hypothetical protein V8T62_06185 [Oscillospiraceae bacterium]|nr:hypothetical protein [Oscillospiraceae bacterium]MDD7042193.1 hypothetical protein [Oscillospiraceae bacterium]MDY2610999.1 hypothetical protein [Oscillospiraceae bacterium]